MTVYLDTVMGLNFLVDLLLLLGTNRLSGFPPGLKRCTLAAAFGALYSGACMIPRIAFLGNALWRLVSLGILCSLAFGWNSSGLRRAGIFALLSLALGGIAVRFGKGDVLPLLLCMGILWLLCRIGFGDGTGGKEYVPVTLRYGEKTAKILALTDTGNGLRDPVTGEQVLVISSEIAQRLTGLTEEQLHKPLETLVQRPLAGLRLVPYRTVGGSGMLLAMQMDQVEIGKRRQKAVVAFAPADFGREEVYQALTGGTV